MITLKRSRNQSVWVDLHSHSTASDGVRSPSSQARYIAEQGVRLAALSDHDTLEGCAEFAREAAAVNMLSIPAVEITVSFPYTRTAELHLLAYGMHAGHEPLDSLLAKGMASRTKRVEAMMHRLQELLPAFDSGPVREQLSTGKAGRPHLARALLKQGLVRHLPEAFYLYLGEGKAAYIPRDIPTCEEVMELLRPLGAWIFVAHPLKNLPLQEISRLIAMGLHGVEVWHPGHTTRQSRMLAELAARNRLSTSAGSDDHGNPGRPWQRPGGDVSYLRGPFAEALREMLAGKIDCLPPAP